MMEESIRKDVNRLYWESDESIAGIADRLGISRRALYDAIEPRPAGATCPACGGALGLRNRTAAERRQAECPDCGYETTLDRDAAAGAEPPRVQQDPEAARPSPVRPRRAVSASGASLVGAALLVGLAVGAAAGYFLRRL